VTLDDASLVFELDVPLPTIEEIQVGGQVFHRLSLPGYGAAGSDGQPELLQTGIMLGIPSDGPVELRIVDAKIEDLPGAYRIYPNPQWAVERNPESGAVDYMAGVQKQFTWDANAYQIDQFQPIEVATVAETAFVRGQRVARVSIQPVQYNPAQGKVRIYRYLKVEAIFPEARNVAAQGNTVSDLFDPMLRDQLLNFNQASAWRTERGQPLASGRLLEGIYPGDTSRPWFKTQLNRSGLYKVTLADVQGMELAPLAAANPAYLQVWARGQQVAAEFIGDNDAQFEADEALLFYAHIEPTIYSDTDVYWLSVGDSPGLRMTTSNAAPSGAATDTSAWAKARLEQDNIYKSDLPRYGVVTAYPRWYWAELSTILGVTSYTVNQALPTAVTSGYNAVLRVRMQGGSQVAAVNPDHRMRVELNGQVAGVMTWDGLLPVEREFQVPASWLAQGNNAVTLAQESIPGVSLDSSFLDWIEIEYRQALLAVNDRVSFTAPGGAREFLAQGFSAQDVLGFDVSNTAAPVRLTGLQTTPTAGQIEGQTAPTAPDSLAFSVRFGVNSATARSYELARVATIGNVSPLSRDTGSALRSLANRADYLLIAHRSLWPSAQTLADHRQSRGLAVALIDIQDVYDEFSNGRMDPGAIRDFVAFAYGNWQAPAPSYLLLLGGGHYDYRLRTGLTTQPVLIPPYIACVDPWVCEVAVDNEFVAVSGGDRLADLAVGRLPARNLAEATVMVNKAVNYGTSPPSGMWANTLAFVADNARDANGVPDSAGNFEVLSQGIINLIPSSYAIKRVYYDPYPTDDNGEPFRYRTPTATTDAIVAAVNSGAVFLNYIGHAAINQWAHEALLRTSVTGRNDVTRMTNGSRQPVVLDMACLSGDFANPLFTGIQVTMLAWPTGGSVAGWGATGFGVATGHDRLHTGFYQAIFNNGVRTLGLATAAGKQYLWATGANLDLLDTFDLLGDPALALTLPVPQAYLPLVTVR
jgi:hypothetical protein